MSSLSCKKCGSSAVKKNGRTTTGRQKYHCKACGVHTTTEHAAQERAQQLALAEHLHYERVSQRGIARTTGLSRNTIIRYLKKSTSRRSAPP